MLRMTSSIPTLSPARFLLLAAALGLCSPAPLLAQGAPPKVEFDIDGYYRARGQMFWNLFDQEFPNGSSAQGRNVHGGLVRLHLNDLLVGDNLVAHCYVEANDGRLRDRFTELGHQDRNFRHCLWGLGLESEQVANGRRDGLQCRAMGFPEARMVGNGRISRIQALRRSVHVPWEATGHNTRGRSALVRHDSYGAPSRV